MSGGGGFPDDADADIHLITPRLASPSVASQSRTRPFSRRAAYWQTARDRSALQRAVGGGVTRHGRWAVDIHQLRALGPARLMIALSTWV